MQERPYLSIGEVLGLLLEEFPDVTISKIRFLESQGLIDPERTPSGYRKFYDDDVACLRWILRQHPGSRLVLSAHNGHVSKSGIFELPGYGVIQSLGRALTQDRAAAGDEDLSMVVIGSAIGAGSFYAVPASGGANRVFEIERAQEGGHEAALFAVLQQPALLDLRAAPAGAVRVWLDTPRAHTGVGGNWDPAWLTQAGYSKLTPLTAE